MKEKKHIYVFIDIGEGHILTLIGLCQSLKKGGYEITMFGIADHREWITGLGFNYITIFEDVYPPGYYNNVYKEESRQGKRALGKPHVKNIMNGELDTIFHDLKPDLLIVSAYIALEGLVLHYKYGIDPILFSCTLTEPDLSQVAGEEFARLPGDEAFELLNFITNHARGEISNVRDLLDPIDQFKEFIACPRELEITGQGRSGNAHYVEACIREGEKQPYPLLDQIGEKDLIYTGFGSQTSLFANESKTFFGKLIRMMARPEFADKHLIISVGSEFDVNEFDVLSDNVTLENWVPQLEILKRADLVINHSGFNTIKECIFHGIPMVAYPILHDGPKNAERITFHNIGVSVDGMTIDQDELAHSVLKAMYDEQIQKSIKTMQHAFCDAHENPISVKIVDEIFDKALVAV